MPLKNRKKIFSRGKLIIRHDKLSLPISEALIETHLNPKSLVTVHLYSITSNY